MRHKISGEDVENSSSFKSAKDKAVGKASSSKERLVEIWDALLASFRLLRACATGRYRDIPWASLVSIVAAVLYFVMPLDLIPDFILGLGLIDDVALLG